MKIVWNLGFFKW